MTSELTTSTTCRGGPGCKHTPEIQWNDSERRAQRARFDGGIEPQYCDDIAYDLWLRIKEQVETFAPGERIDVPLPRVISRVLGVYCAATTLKKDPMHALELSLKEISNVAGYCKSHVAAALRWLGEGGIFYKGKQVGQGLGVIKRVIRKGQRRLCGRLKCVYRTSVTALTEAGRALVGLIVFKPSRDKPFDRAAFKREKREKIKAARQEALSKVTKSIASFFGQKLSLHIPSKPGLQTQSNDDISESTSPFERYYMNEARRVLAGEGKVLGASP